jgi:hypothetical protein
VTAHSSLQPQKRHLVGAAFRAGAVAAVFLG